MSRISIYYHKIKQLRRLVRSESSLGSYSKKSVKTNASNQCVFDLGLCLMTCDPMTNPKRQEIRERGSTRKRPAIHYTFAFVYVCVCVCVEVKSVRGQCIIGSKTMQHLFIMLTRL